MASWWTYEDARWKKRYWWYWERILLHMYVYIYAHDVDSREATKRFS